MFTSICVHAPIINSQSHESNSRPIKAVTLDVLPISPFCFFCWQLSIICSGLQWKPPEITFVIIILFLETFIHSMTKLTVRLRFQLYWWMVNGARDINILVISIFSESCLPVSLNLPCQQKLVFWSAICFWTIKHDVWIMHLVGGSVATVILWVVQIKLFRIPTTSLTANVPVLCEQLSSLQSLDKSFAESTAKMSEVLWEYKERETRCNPHRLKISLALVIAILFAIFNADETNQ